MAKVAQASQGLGGRVRWREEKRRDQNGIFKLKNRGWCKQPPRWSKILEKSNMRWNQLQGLVKQGASLILHYE